MAGFSTKMLVTYREWRERAETMGWGTGLANHDQKINPEDGKSETIRQRITSFCPWYYVLENTLHGGHSESRAPVSIRKQ